MNKFKIILVSLFLWSCQSLNTISTNSNTEPVQSLNSKDSSAPVVPTPKVAIKTQIEKVFKQVADGQCTEAIPNLQNLEKDTDAVPYSQSIRLAVGDCELQLEDYEQAEKDLRSVASYTSASQPMLAAKSYLLLSYVYEGLGDDTKALSSALDAERMSSYLGLPSSLAEVPARLAMLYSQMDDLNQAALYLTKADEGIRVLRSRNPQLLGSTFWAQIYYFMGFKSLDQIDEQGISVAIQGLMAVQKYSLKSLEFDDPNWSKKSYSQMQKNYLTLWQLIQSDPPQKSILWSNDDYKIKEQRTKWLAQLSELIRQAQLFQPDETQPKTANTAEIYKFLNQLEQQTSQQLQLTSRKTALTVESLNLNSSVRPGRIYPSQFFPAELKKSTSSPSEESQ